MSETTDYSYKSRRKNLYGSPYPFKESIGWLFRNAFGLSKKNKEAIKDHQILNPGKIILNPNLKPKYCIGFVGDIMDMKGYSLSIGKSVIDFFHDANFLVGNFEATITDKKSSMTAQRHTKSIIPLLSRIFNPKNTILSVANNHTGDFNRDIFMNSVDILKNAGFRVFGYDNYNSENLNQDIRIITGSSWSNLQCNYLPTLKDQFENELTEEKKFNILYPHWGYELELYPRQETVNKAKNYFNNQNIDSIIGHHSHCPQPVCLDYQNKELKTGARLVAYSLGDFSIGLKMKKYQNGIILKMWLGNNNETLKLELQSLEFSYTKCSPINDKEFCVDKIDSLNIE